VTTGASLKNAEKAPASSVAEVVGLVDDQRVVVGEGGVGLGFGQQDAVGHEFDQGAGSGFVVEANLVADRTAELDLEFVGDAFGDRDGSDAARLGAADGAADAVAEFEQEFGQLGGLARTGVAADDHHGVFTDGGEQVLAAFGDGEFGVVERGDRGGAARYLFGRERALFPELRAGLPPWFAAGGPLGLALCLGRLGLPGRLG